MSFFFFFFTSSPSFFIFKMDGYQGAPIRQPVAMAYLCAGKFYLYLLQ